jgi:hypothetical protein
MGVETLAGGHVFNANGQCTKCGMTMDRYTVEGEPQCSGKRDASKNEPPGDKPLEE